MTTNHADIRALRCSCGKTLRIRSPNKEITVKCPNCGKQLKVAPVEATPIPQQATATAQTPTKQFPAEPGTTVPAYLLEHKKAQQRNQEAVAMRNAKSNDANREKNRERMIRVAYGVGGLGLIALGGVGLMVVANAFGGVTGRRQIRGFVFIALIPLAIAGLGVKLIFSAIGDSEPE